ncbi:hypothetical protein BKA62DRAFT_759896 [Auriculariales sp. MPI-PUGE-AT-0066]|nr:hypothetical protein BKA62DRAFT_759896 [Auriculariales sp. MPI-PUGE-AT-0066]
MSAPVASSDSPNQTAPEYLRHSPYQLPDTVRALSAAVNVLQMAPRAMFCSRRVSQLHAAAEAINTAVVTSCTHNRLREVPFIAKPALETATVTLTEITRILQRRARMCDILQFITAISTHNIVGNYLAATIELKRILRVDTKSCGLLDDPQRCQLLPDIGDRQTGLRFCEGISTWSAISDSFKTVLSATAAASDGINTAGLAMPLKAISQTTLMLWMFCVNLQACDDDLADLLTEIDALWTAVKLHHVDRPDNSGNLDADVQKFLRCLLQSAIKISLIRASSRLKRFAAAHTVGASIRSTLVDLRNATKAVMLSFTASTSGGVQRLEVSVRRLTANTTLIADKMESLSPTLANLHFSATPPPPPCFFLGREKIVEDYIALLTKPHSVPLAILGSGGIGKTALALYLLHHEATKQHFGEHRFFVSCEAITSAEGLAAGLATLFDLEPTRDPLTAVVRHLNSSNAATLLVIDNLDTILNTEDSGLRDKVNNILAVLQVPLLSLVITARGDRPPSAVNWANKKEGQLASLTLGDARRLFSAVTGVGLDAGEAIQLDELLRVVDCMPLAVCILSQLAEGGQTPSQLLQRWRVVQTRMLQVQETGRLSNIEVSIQLSLDCLPQQPPEARQLLALCSLLPDGLSSLVRDRLQVCFPDISLPIETLRRLAIVQVIGLGPDRVVKILNPIRVYVQNQDRLPIEAAQYEVLVQSYIEIALSTPIAVNENYRALRDSFAPEQGNTNAVLLHQIRILTEEPAKQLVKAVDRLSKSLMLIGENPVILDELIPRLVKYPHRQRDAADCLNRRANALQMFGKYSESIQESKRACELYEMVEKDAIYDIVWRQCMDGQTYCWQGQYEKAEKESTAALERFRELHRQDFGAATALRDLGYLAYCKGDFSLAKTQTEAARCEYERLGRPLQAAQCTRNLGEIALSQDSPEEAEQHLLAAISELEPMGAGGRQVIATCNKFLGRICHMRSQLDRADALYEQSRIQSGKLCSETLGFARRSYFVGLLRVDQMRFQEAACQFGDALNSYRRIGHLAHLILTQFDVICAWFGCTLVEKSCSAFWCPLVVRERTPTKSVRDSLHHTISLRQHPKSVTATPVQSSGSNMPTIFDLPLELLGSIVEFVALREDVAPADIAAAAATRSDAKVFKGSFGCKVITQRAPIVSNTGNLARTNHTFATVTNQVLERLRDRSQGLPLKLDILLVNERELWTTWIHVPTLKGRHVDRIDAYIRIAGGHVWGQENALNTIRNGMMMGPAALVHAFYFLLASFMRRGPAFDAQKESIFLRLPCTVDREELAAQDRCFSARKITINISVLEGGIVAAEEVRSEWRLARRRTRFLSDTPPTDEMSELFNQCMRPEWLAEYLVGYNGLDGMIEMRQPDFGAVIHERIGEISLLVEGNAFRQYDIGEQFAALLNPTFMVGDHVHQRIHYYWMVPSEQRLLTFAQWWRDTLQKRTELNLSVGTATEADTPWPDSQIS